LPARIVKADGNGSVVIDLKPSTWIGKAEQVKKLRRRRQGSSDRSAAVADVRCAAPICQRSPSVAAMMARQSSAADVGGSGAMPQPGPVQAPARRSPSMGFLERQRPMACPSPMRQRSPSVGALQRAPPPVGAPPMCHRTPSVGSKDGLGNSPSAARLQRDPSPSCAGGGGGGGGGGRAASPRRSPSPIPGAIYHCHHVTPSVAAGTPRSGRESTPSGRAASPRSLAGAGAAVCRPNGSGSGNPPRSHETPRQYRPPCGPRLASPLRRRPLGAGGVGAAIAGA
jgi:hypothetical protein